MSKTVTTLVAVVFGWAMVGQAQELAGTVTVDPGLSSGQYQSGFASADLVFDGTLSVSITGRRVAIGADGLATEYESITALVRDGLRPMGSVTATADTTGDGVPDVWTFASEDVVCGPEARTSGLNGTVHAGSGGPFAITGFVQSCNPDEGGVVFEIHGDLGPVPSPCLKPVGRWSSGYGEIKTMAATDDGRYLLVGQGTTLVVLDLSDPLVMVPIAELPVDGVVNQIVVAGGFAYVAADDAGLLVIDVENPEQPRVADVVDPMWRADRVSVSGGLAAVAEPGGLRLLDIGDPLRVHAVGWLATDRRVHDVSLSGSVAAITAGSIHLVDVSDPASPEIVSDLDDGDGTGGTGIAVVGAHLLTDVSDRIHVFDVSNPATPILVRRDGFYPGLETIDAVGDFAVINAGFNGALLLDLAEPAKPVDRGWVRHEEPVTAATLAGPLLVVATASRLESYWVGLDLNPEIEGLVQPPGWARHLAVSRNLAILGLDEQKVAVVDVEDPQNPRVRGVLDLPGSWAPSVAIHGTVACALNPEHGLSVIDVSDPAQPGVIGHLEGLQGFDLYDAPMGMGEGFVVVGGYTLRLVDLEDLAAPTVTDETGIGGGSKFAVSGDLIYVGYGTYGLWILRAEQGRFVEVSTLDLGGEVQNLVVAGDRVYARVNHFGDGVRVHVVDVSDPECPRAFGSVVVAGHGLAGFGDSVVVVGWDEYRVVNAADGMRPFLERTALLPRSGPGDIVAIGHGVGLANGGFWIIDPRFDPRLADASLPVTDRRAVEVSTQGDRVVMADGNLTVFDVTEPAQPIEIGAIETPGSASATAYGSDRLLVADGGSGLSIFHLTAGADVDEAIHWATVGVGGEALDVAVAGGFAYVAADTMGLAVVDLDDEVLVAILHHGEDGYSNHAHPRSCEISGNHLFVGYDEASPFGFDSEGLDVYDISNPAQPVFLGAASGSLSGRGLAVVGDLVVGATTGSSLGVFDVSDPTDPVRLGGVNVGGAWDVTHAGGNHFIFADGTNGVILADLSDPAGPRILRRLQTPGEATGLAVTEDLVYVADGSGGLTVLDRSLCPISSGEHPVVASD